MHGPHCFPQFGASKLRAWLLEVHNANGVARRNSIDSKPKSRSICHTSPKG